MHMIYVYLCACMIVSRCLPWKYGEFRGKLLMLILTFLCLPFTLPRILRQGLVIVYDCIRKARCSSDFWGFSHFHPPSLTGALSLQICTSRTHFKGVLGNTRSTSCLHGKCFAHRAVITVSPVYGLLLDVC